MNSRVILLALVVAPVGIYLFMGLKGTVHAGPSSRHGVVRYLRAATFFRHTAAAALAVASGFDLASSTFGAFSAALPSLFVGLPAGGLWSIYRMRKTVLASAGPDESVPEDRLFPSDRFAQILKEGRVPPLPLWVDMPILIACAAIGVLIASLTGRA